MLTLPEMLFGHNKVELQHLRSGVGFSFCALDALKVADGGGTGRTHTFLIILTPTHAYARTHTCMPPPPTPTAEPEVHKALNFCTRPWPCPMPLPPHKGVEERRPGPTSSQGRPGRPLQHVLAWTNYKHLSLHLPQEWKKAREAEIQQQQAVQLEYDWTYTTPFAGVMHVGAGDSAGPRAHGPSSAPTEAATAGGGHHHRGLDQPTVPGQLPQAVSHCSSSSGSSSSMPGGQGHVSSCQVQWQDTDEQIDRSMLMARDPILFFDEVPLYESGACSNSRWQYPELRTLTSHHAHMRKVSYADTSTNTVQTWMTTGCAS